MMQLRPFIQEKDVSADFNTLKGLQIMLKRILTSVVGVAILLPVLIFSDTYVFPIAVTIVSLIALYEMFSCIGLKNKNWATLPAYLIGGILPILVKVMHGSGHLGNIMLVLIVAYIIYLFSIIIFRNTHYSINEMTLAFMTSVYIIAGFLSIVFLRELYGNIYLLVFIGAWITDIFAYFSGRFFGKHKLCEAVSPKKTIEGSIGGIIFCSLSFAVFAIITKGFNQHISYYLIYSALGIIVSAISQIGDLSMSLIKRQYKIKDFGKIFPGHGGILDRFDSIIAVALALFIIVSTMNVFNINII